MKRARGVVFAFLVIWILLGALAREGEKAAAQAPVRRTTIIVPYTEYEWWLIVWDSNEIVCRIVVDQAGLPTGDEVLKFCGNELFQAWQATQPCNEPVPALCEGLYLHFLSSQEKEREVVVDLPPPVVWVDLAGCTPLPPENRCQTLPSLVLTGVEPLPNEHITAIRGFYDANPFSCDTMTCTLPLHASPLEGSTIEFWAESSFGDMSERYTAQVRIIDTGVTQAPGGGGWYVDVISTQWRGAPLEGCARTWQAFPPIGGPPTWLSTPDQNALLASDRPYYYLAGRLISQGQVDASSCVTGGLLPNGYADACGLDVARPLVEAWQNQFDARIIEIAQETGVPGQLMKNLFAQESQFWPGVFRVPYEFGLGQITDKGADAILLWNSEFFDQFCSMVLSQDACDAGYLHLEPENQAILRGALALTAKADCPGCAAGVDLNNTNFSVSLFARTLQANCAQVGRIVTTATGHVPGTLATYEDLWRFTVANYHAGPGCVSYAIHTAWQSGGVLNWEQVSTRFTEACKGVVPYVDKITR